MARNKRINKKKSESITSKFPFALELLKASRIETELSDNVFEQIEITDAAIRVLDKIIRKSSENRNSSVAGINEELCHILFSKIDDFIYCLSEKEENKRIFKNKNPAKSVNAYEIRVKNIEKKIIVLLNRLSLTRNAGIKKGFGTHEAEITSVKLLNENGRETNVFVTGKPFLAEISYIAHKELQRPMFGIAIHHENGAHICGPNTTFSGKTANIRKGKGKLMFRIESLPLLGGKYLFSATLMDYETVKYYDFHWKEFSFSVLTGGLKDKYGLFYIPHTWEYK